MFALKEEKNKNENWRKESKMWYLIKATYSDPLMTYNDPKVTCSDQNVTCSDPKDLRVPHLVTVWPLVM